MSSKLIKGVFDKIHPVRMQDFSTVSHAEKTIPVKVARVHYFTVLETLVDLLIGRGGFTNRVRNDVIIFPERECLDSLCEFEFVLRRAPIRNLVD
jgi:hypothetical protein